MVQLGKGLKAFIMLLMTVLVVSACSGDGENKKKGESSGGTKDVRQEVKVRINDDPDFLDPHLATASISYQMILNMFEGLMAPQTDGTLEPALAKTFEVSEDGLTYTFTLKEGLTFHNGEPVTVEDVKYTFDRLMGTESGEPLSSSFENVVALETPDDQTFILRLSEPNSNFLYSMTALHSAIIPKSNDGQHNENPIGTGPFKFESYTPGNVLKLEKNSEYWKEGLPYLEKVDFVFQTDDQSAMLALQSGEVDLTRVIVHQIPQVENDFTLNYQENNSALIISMNQDRKPFNDVRVRQAIHYAVNKQDIIDSVYSGYAVKLGSNMSPAMGEYYKDGLQDVYNRDVEKAKKLLAEAGYPDGFKTTISVSSHNSMYADIAQVTVENLKEIGIDAEIEVVEWGIWLDRIYFGRDYDLTTIDLTGRPSAYEILDDYVSTNDSENFFRFKNEEYDELMKAVLKETDVQKQIDIYHRAQEVLNEQAAAVHIADYQLVWGLTKGLEGQKTYPFWFHDMSEMRFVE